MYDHHSSHVLDHLDQIIGGLSYAWSAITISGFKPSIKAGSLDDIGISTRGQETCSSKRFQTPFCLAEDL